MWSETVRESCAHCKHCLLNVYEWKVLTQGFIRLLSHSIQFHRYNFVLCLFLEIPCLIKHIYLSLMKLLFQYQPCRTKDWRRHWHPTPVLLPGKSHGWRSLVGCSPWGRKESDTTERLHFHFSLSCIGEGNGNLLQCSCLENPRDGGTWWAAVYGVSQSWTRLKRLSSSSRTKDHIK